MPYVHVTHAINWEPGDADQSGGDDVVKYQKGNLYRQLAQR